MTMTITMSKSLMLSALAASAVSHAQSNVTLHGTVDLYANRATGSLTSRSQLASGGNHSSKLIFRGSEDLGGGMAAGFWFESGLNADTGLGTASNSNNQPSGTAAAPAGTQAITFNRRAIVTLKGPWGEFQAGRNWSPTYDAFSGRFDVFGVGSGIGINYAGSINPNNVRVSNNITYITPRFAGFAANIQRWLGENSSNSVNSKDGNGEGIRVHYDNGSFGAIAAWARTRFLAGNAIYREVAMTYDFGVLRLTGNVNHDQRGMLKQEGAMIGMVLPIGVAEFKASYSYLRVNTPRGAEGKKLAVGYVYNLSRRSAIYTTLARIENSNGASFAIAGSTTAPNKSSTGFDVGIRHNF